MHILVRVATIIIVAVIVAGIEDAHHPNGVRKPMEFKVRFEVFVPQGCNLWLSSGGETPAAPVQFVVESWGNTCCRPTVWPLRSSGTTRSGPLEAQPGDP